MRNKFLITGATGFIGTNITKTLVERGERVSIIVRSKKLHPRLIDISSKIDIHEADIRSPSIGKIINKIRPDYIFHLAAYGVLPNQDSPFEMTDINIKGTVNLFQAVKQNPFKLFINTGSSVEYGIKDKKMKESDLLVPINDYGITKSTATLYCQKEGIRNKLPIITFRLFTPFGYYEDKNRLIPSVILSALKNEPIKVSAPTYVRDFIFIDDLINAYLAAVNTKFKPGEILNIGSGKCFPISDIVKIILEIIGSKSKVIWGGVEKQERFIESKKWEADMSKTKRILKLKPEQTLRQGLEKTIDWFSKNQKFYV